MMPATANSPRKPLVGVGFGRYNFVSWRYKDVLFFIVKLH
jgi:hypothetical protein